MRHYNLELPKYRLQFHVKLVKRRKPLLEEPILPNKSVVKQKYRTGSLPARFIRYFADHKSIKKIFASAFAFVAISTILLPHPINTQAEAAESVVIEAETKLITEKSMIYPVGKVIINQGYGAFHKAIDLGGVLGTSVKPVMAGIVAYAGWDKTGYGNLVILQHKSGLQSYYAHLSKIEVKTGQTVSTDNEIGKMGATGHSTGVHLHLEINQNGISLNPLAVLSK